MTATQKQRLTPQQVALLWDVYSGDVVQAGDDHGWIWAWRVQPLFKPRKVDHSMRRLTQRELTAHQNWRLTPAGLAVIGARP